MRHEVTGEPGFHCTRCNETLYRIRCYQDYGNRHWAEMLNMWLDDHDQDHTMGRAS